MRLNDFFTTLDVSKSGLKVFLRYLCKKKKKLKKNVLVKTAKYLLSISKYHDSLPCCNTSVNTIIKEFVAINYIYLSIQVCVTTLNQ